MADLSVKIGNVIFPNPVFLAGGPGVTPQTLESALENGAGGIVTKTFQLKPYKQISPRLYKAGKLGIVNLEGPSEEESSFWIRVIESFKKRGFKVVASIIGWPEQPYTELTTLARQCEEAGADVLEYVFFHFVSRKPAADSLEPVIDTTQDPRVVYDITKAIREVVSIPISAKLPPTTLDISRLAMAAQLAGANAVSAVNTIPNTCPGVNLETGKPLAPALGNYSGPALKPVGLGAVARIKKAVDIHVSGVGGIVTWRDVAEYIMLGAGHVQIATAFFEKGPAIFGELTKGLSEFMDNHGYKNIKEMCGVALPHLRHYSEVEKKDLVALRNEEWCNQCGLCVRSCVYNAINQQDKLVIFDQARCRGCGMCSQVCNRQAITFIERSN